MHDEVVCCADFEENRKPSVIANGVFALTFAFGLTFAVYILVKYLIMNE